ncbi:MAG: cyclic dehypoxanthinyl futalosine synthase [Zavarzinella sp.]
MNSTIQQILSKAANGERITFAEGVELFSTHDLTALGKAAHAVTTRLHPEPFRTYNIDRNVNYTNVCAAVCDFCAFYRKSADADAYVLSREELHQKIEETIALGGDQILLQGGMHPQLKLEWYEEMLRDLKLHFPQVNLHAFSPPELWHFHRINKIPLVEVLSRLKEAGLGSLPGGGAEILVDRVRKQLTKGKALADEWLEVNRVWHQLGGKSTCTMMFGHIETIEERVEHLDRLRKLQDETNGFTAFICWTMQPGHLMADYPAYGSFEYLKTQAIARLYLDNIPNIQSSWVTQGAKIGQVALFYGANDMGSLMIEENVVASAGTVHYLTLEQIKSCIREAGYIPRQRNVFYEYIDEQPSELTLAGVA